MIFDECPYCGAEQEINHDDGYGMDEAGIHQQNCTECDKVFGYTTSICIIHETFKTPCLNGDADHILKETHTFPPEFKRLRCTVCEEEFPL